MAINIGPKIGIEGEAEYRKQLNNIITETKTLHAEMRSMESAFDKDTSAKEKAEKQTEALNRAIEAQEKRVAEVSRGLEESKRKFGENDERTMRWRQALANAETELHNLENELKAIPNSVQLLGQSMQDTGEKIEKVGKTMTTVGRTMTRTITTPILALGTAAVKTTSDFDTSMSKVQAISGATGSDFDALRSKAREMGAETKYSASEAADAMTYMAMAGWKTEDMLQGVEGIMYLAAASGEDLATTSDIVTDALTAFGKSAEESGHLADIMAAASSNANTNVGLMGETFKYVAPVAGALGLSMEDTAVAIGLMANAGIKGSQSGTALRNILTRMAKPTKESQTAMDALGISLTNSDGSMRSLEEIMQDLRTGFGGLTEAEQAQYAAMLAGQRGMSGLLAIVNAAPADYAKLRQAVDNSTGSAKNMATTMQDNLAGQLTILKSQLQELAISFGDIMVPQIRKAVEWVQNQVTAFSQLDDRTKEQIIKFAALAAAIGPVVSVLGKLTTGVGAFTKGAGKVIEKLGGSGLSANFTAVGVAIGGAVTAIGALTAADKALESRFKDTEGTVYSYRDELHELNNQADATKSAVDSAAQAVGDSVDSYEKNTAQIEAQADVARGLATELETLAGKQNKSKTESDRMKVIVAQLNAIYPDLALSIDEETGALNKNSQEIRDNIDQIEKLSLAQAQQAAYQEVNERISEALVARAEATAELEALEKELSDSTDGVAESSAQAMEAHGTLGKKIKETEGSIAELDEEIERGNATLDILQQQTGATADSADGLADSVEGSADAATDAEGALDALGDSAEDASGDMVSATDEIIAAYEESYEAAKGSLIGQKDLFTELEEAEGTSIDAMISGLESHIEASRNYSENIKTLTGDARYSTDENFRAMVNYIIAAGDDMAPELQAIVDAMANGDDDISRLVDDFGEMSQLDDELADETARAATVSEYGLEDVVDALDGGLDEAVDTIADAEKPISTESEAVGEAAPKKITEGVNKSKPAMDRALKGLPAAVLTNINAIKNQASAAQAAGNVIPTSAATGTTAGAPVLGTALAAIPNKVSTTLTTVSNMRGTARNAGNAIPTSAAAGTTAGTPALGTALAGMQNKFTSTLSAVNALKGSSTEAGKTFVNSGASGVTSSTNGNLNTATNNMVSRFKTGLSNVLALKGQAQQAGSTVGSSTAAGMQGTVGRVTTASNRIKTAAENPLKGMQNNTYTWGEHATSNFANGLSSSTAVSRVSSKASAIAQIVANKLKHTTPKEGPLKDDDVWGEHLAENFAKGMDNGARTVAAAAENLGFAAEAGMSEAVSIDPAVISGRSGLSATISHIIGGGIDPAAIYAAVRDGAAAAETSVVIGEREFARILRNAGVAWA